MDNDKVISLDDIKKESKRRERKEKFKQFVNNALVWIEDNKEIVMISVPVFGLAVKGAVGVTKKLIISHNLNKQIKIKENYCYDPSLGHYWELKRKLSNAEWVEIDRRKKAGERLADILSDLRVLK